MRHCRSVANLAIEIADRKALETDRNEIEEAAMLHDLGIFLRRTRDRNVTGQSHISSTESSVRACCAKTECLKETRAWPNDTQEQE
ncbi:HD domain-containing protein [Duncaniella dubosii]|uniref:HD domain-containing protein n=1 Tax=Duncaniella dubosii TaxID=2518971 RepID=UPI003F679B9B